MSAAPTVTVIDAGVGNLGNVERAFRHLGAAVEVTADPAVVAAARLLVLPGVGAFRPPRERLRGALESSLGEAVAAGAWLLGICVGFQLLFEGSDEHGWTDGLGLLGGRVERLPAGVPLPHIGWNPLVTVGRSPLVDGLDGEPVYFVHSYAPVDVPEGQRLATALHGRDFVAVAGKGRVVGTQFHPERSGEAGLRLLRGFLEMASCS